MVSLWCPPNCSARNPIVQSIYTADPAPLVHEGTVHLYTGHDEDDAPNNQYRMHDYRCFSTTDMVNWTDHGAVLDIRPVLNWSGGDANAAQCIYRNGELYYYVSTGNTKGALGRRAVCVEYLDFNVGGTTKPITQTAEGISRNR